MLLSGEFSVARYPFEDNPELPRQRNTAVMHTRDEISRRKIAALRGAQNEPLVDDQEARVQIRYQIPVQNRAIVFDGADGVVLDDFRSFRGVEWLTS
jgi:hypothetical protein